MKIFLKIYIYYKFFIKPYNKIQICNFLSWFHIYNWYTLYIVCRLCEGWQRCVSIHVFIFLYFKKTVKPWCYIVLSNWKVTSREWNTHIVTILAQPRVFFLLEKKLKISSCSILKMNKKCKKKVIWDFCF